jgi:16S rRNA (guanine527-N7)-methyltransferase
VDAQALARQAATLGCSLTADDAGRLLTYLDAMLEANRHLNLTGIRDREQAVVLHVLDSLAAGLLPISPGRCLDLGSGNGFPGVALSVLWPRARVVLMDRTGKRVRAMQQCLQRAGLERCTALHMDAAMVPGLQPDLVFDLIAVRAVAPPLTVAPIAAPLIAPGGNLLLWKDSSPPSQELPGEFSLEQSQDYELPPPAARSMQLALYRRA